MKGRVWDVSLGRRGRSSYGEGERGMRSCSPTTSQILRPPGFGFCLSDKVSHVDILERTGIASAECMLLRNGLRWACIPDARLEYAQVSLL